MSFKPVIFVSCGQYSAEEIALGNEVERLIRDGSQFEPYFAEQQNTLEALVANILNALNNAVGLIAIMHKRGEVNSPAGKSVTRGSVWIEQELAIAAFIQHTLKRRIDVTLYLQEGIDMEGIRQQLRLKPIPFKTSDDVIRDVRAKIAQWNLSPIVADPQVVDRYVKTEYSERSGLGKRIAEEGFSSAWVTADDEHEKIMLHGYEYALEDLPDGTKARLKARDHPAVGGYLVLMKRKQL